MCVCMKSYRGCSMSVLSSMMSSQPFTVTVKLKTLTHMQFIHTHTHTHRQIVTQHITVKVENTKFRDFLQELFDPLYNTQRNSFNVFSFFLYLLLSAKCIRASQRLLAAFSAALDWLTEVGLQGNSSPLSGALFLVRSPPQHLPHNHADVLSLLFLFPSRFAVCCPLLTTLSFFHSFFLLSVFSHTAEWESSNED